MRFLLASCAVIVLLVMATVPRIVGWQLHVELTADPSVITHDNQSEEALPGNIALMAQHTASLHGITFDTGSLRVEVDPLPYASPGEESVAAVTPAGDPRLPTRNARVTIRATFQRQVLWGLPWRTTAEVVSTGALRNIPIKERHTFP